jgi:hypothetical protein
MDWQGNSTKDQGMNEDSFSSGLGSAGKLPHLLIATGSALPDVLR